VVNSAELTSNSTSRQLLTSTGAEDCSKLRVENAGVSTVYSATSLLRSEDFATIVAKLLFVETQPNWN
jgi:hypothetical protein